jgi:poly-gamma-glutamate synthesis protein (capsule biosynthesis protein)
MRKIHQMLKYGGLLALLLVSSCSPAFSIQVNQLFPSIVDPTPTPFQPLPPTATATASPTPTPLPIKEFTYWLDPSIPPALASGIHLPAAIRQVDTAEQSTLQIGALRGGDLQTTWVYALAAPFPTLLDNLSLAELQKAWRGEPGEQFSGTLIMSPATQAAFATRWGPSGDARLKIFPEDQLLDQAWNTPSTLAILPFENIQPRWKVLHVDGKSIFDKSLNLSDYPLTVWFGINGQPDALKALGQTVTSAADVFPAGNRDLDKMTVLVMTGVTALTRATGHKMDTLGTTYPAADIQDWLRNADLTHISNEVSFNPDCPMANPNDTSTIFCSRPEYIELLDFIGADMIELSGNHNNDYGVKADAYSLDLYKQRNWLTFAGGANLEEAQKPATSWLSSAATRLDQTARGPPTRPPGQRPAKIMNGCWMRFAS